MGFMKLGVWVLTLKIVLYFYGQCLIESSGISIPQLHKALGVVGNLRATEVQNITIR